MLTASHTQSPVAGACWHLAQSFPWTSGHREVGGGAGESLEPSIRPRKGLGPRQELGHRDGRQGLLHQTGGMVQFGVQALQATFRKKRQVREAGRAPPPLPGNDSGSATRRLPALLITHSHFTSPLCPPAIHVICHFRREGRLRSGGQGEDPGPAEHHAGVDRRAAVLGAFQGGQAVTRGPPPQGGARRRRLQSRRLPVCLPLLLSSAPSNPNLSSFLPDHKSGKDITNNVNLA